MSLFPYTCTDSFCLAHLQWLCHYCATIDNFCLASLQWLNESKKTRNKTNQKTQKPKPNTKQATKNEQQTRSGRVISWSVHSHLKRSRRDDNIASPLGLVWQMKTRANQQQHENAIQQSVSQEATKAQCGNRGSPEPGAKLKLNIVKRGVKTDLRRNKRETTGAQGHSEFSHVCFVYLQR